MRFNRALASEKVKGKNLLGFHGNRDEEQERVCPLPGSALQNSQGLGEAGRIQNTAHHPGVPSTTAVGKHPRKEELLSASLRGRCSWGDLMSPLVGDGLHVPRYLTRVPHKHWVPATVTHVTSQAPPT